MVIVFSGQDYWIKTAMSFILQIPLFDEISGVEMRPLGGAPNLLF